MKKKIIFAIGIFAGLFMSFGGVGEQAFAVVYGCTDRNSWYYNSNATVDDGSCQYFYCSSHNFRTCYSSSCTCDNNTCQIQSDQEKFRERDYMYGSYVWGTCDGNYSGNDCSQYQGLPEVPYRSWYDCTTDHSSSQCSRPLSCGCKDPSAKNYTSNLSAQYTGSCHYCTAGSTDSACIVNFCGEVNDPLVLNAQTLAECSASNPDKTCVSSNNSCEYQPINFCGDVNSPLVANAMTSDQCRAANPGKTCIRDDDLCTYNPGCNDLPYPNVTGEGYECCRPGGVGSRS